MQSLRTRRPFTHASSSTDSDSDSSPTALDEQEQEALIQSLAHQNDARNAQFRLLLLALPLVSAVPYLVALTQAYSNGNGNDNGNGSGNGNGGSGSDRIRALLSLTSLAATAWMLWALPPGVTGIRGVDGWISNTSGKESESEGGSKGTRRKQLDNIPERSNAINAPFWAEERRNSPLAAYLPYLNVALCAVLVLAGLVSKPGASAEGQQQWGHVGLSNLPAVVYGVVIIAKIVMGGVDPERDLSALRYEYKGA
ncbi:uncharacterized protein F4817DRAFT_3410 [Daldinia loculata]|uniref:uncharacterized protein n=1 Tax=Daldinia loculata TaxID=103429 RepID=UPI0020C4D430|nr:uncharacterized protein F4817DRAFT_3410 [Daldinia loculata]KAI1652114.1 hypothetical protein F4817DRAFT_3410 [Daldinia loculata]